MYAALVVLPVLGMRRLNGILLSPHAITFIMHNMFYKTAVGQQLHEPPLSIYWPRLTRDKGSRV